MQNDSSASLDPGDYTFQLEHGSRTRTYLVHVPPHAETRQGLPVVLNFHGGGSNAAGQKAYSRMDRAADREGFIAVYPNGTGVLGERILTWNAGRCCGYAQRKQVDDVGFVVALLEDLARRTAVDKTRVYATGMSNGAMLAYRLAVEVPERIAAIAPVAGAMMVRSFTPSRAVPVMHFHSVDDTLAPYRGGPGRRQLLTRRRIEHPGVEEMLDQWIAYNQCPAKPTVGRTKQGQGKDRGHTATKYTYGPGRDNSEVVLWKITGAGHVWPGGIRNHRKRLLGPGTAIIDANTEMWRFFSRFSLQDRPERGGD